MPVRGGGGRRDWLGGFARGWFSFRLNVFGCLSKRGKQRRTTTKNTTQQTRKQH
jgi:hypothetical protein